jgi:arylsulfatase A-like enzyme
MALHFIRILSVAAVSMLWFVPQYGHAEATDGSVLPFPPVPSASIAGPTLATSTHKRREQPNHLPADAPNIMIILLDDVGFGQADTFGGDIRTPTLTELAKEGIAYNDFNTTAICSPTRAALLTGRNQHRVGSGTIAERAVDWDGYVGVIPKTSATIAEVLKDYGYSTAAFGKWHNTPATETTAMGPFDRWPTGYGFEHFYGFLAGETSQWEPRLVENTNTIEPLHDPNYHLTRDLADQAITWLRQQRSFAPGKPFLMYWAPGAGHGPHHIFKANADAYAGRFDDGWDAMRERVFARQKALGFIPADTVLNGRPDGIAAWDSIPQDQRKFQTRLMEIFAGFVEDADVQAGRIVAELDREGRRDNTLIFYIFGDNGASAEGQNGTISELLAQNNIPSTVEQQMKVLDGLGGIDMLGSPLTDNMYNAGFAWAGNTPFKYTKLVASDFGGTRNPMVVSWPAKIAPDSVPRSQFHHVNDIAPTIYEVLGITPPKVVNGEPQDPIDGVSLAYTFEDPNAPGRKTEQYFENNGSRALYKDGWVAAAFGPLTPWATAGVDYAAWDSDKDPWTLYNVTSDFSEAHDLSAEEPERLAAMKERFLEVAKENKVFPIGAGLWLRIHPEDRVATPYTSWVFDETSVRMPEFTAPGLGRQSTLVKIDADVPANASGVLYALGGMSGGLTLYMDKGELVYEYNMLILERTDIRASAPIAASRHRIEVETTIARPGAPAEVVLRVDGVEVGRGTVPLTVPAAFTASETFDVGIDLGSPVALAYDDRRPFAFDGTVNEMTVDLK